MTTENLLPGWKTVRQIGAGSFGKVYEIEREENGVLKKAALKVMSFPFEPDEVQYFYNIGFVSTEDEASTFINKQIGFVLKEIESMENLKGNRNIVEIQEKMIIPHDGWPGAEILIRMELLTPLSRYLRENSLGENGVIALGIDLCRALETCQSEDPPILHKDINIANIMVDDEGRFKLGDFGITRAMVEISRPMGRRGTEDYTAPEVLHMKGYSVSADIYSLGIVLYKMLNNYRSPFLPTEGAMTMTILNTARMKRENGETIPPPVIGSEELKAVVLKALEYAPEKRYQTATEFRQALESCCQIHEETTKEEVYASPVYASPEMMSMRTDQDNSDRDYPFIHATFGTIDEKESFGENTVLDSSPRDSHITKEVYASPERMSHKPEASGGFFSRLFKWKSKK